MSPLSIRAVTVRQYRAFADEAHLELGRITVLLGRNNAGKTALCLAPWHLAQVADPSAMSPLPSTLEGVSFGDLTGLSHNRALTGFSFDLHLEGGAIDRVGADLTETRPTEGKKPVVLALRVGEEEHRGLERASWPTAAAPLRALSGLAALPSAVHALRGIDRPPQRADYTNPTERPEHVGALGQHASAFLWYAEEEALARLNAWYARFGVRLHVERSSTTFALQARPLGALDRRGPPLVHSGAGLGHALPLAVQSLVAPQRPGLWCIEQPELHLHPRAHVAVAELLIDHAHAHPDQRLLVETHSDVLILRLRREVAAGRLAPDDLRLYFVDDQPGPGSRLRAIPLDAEGSPTWWPKDVFAEPLREYAEIRRALRERHS